MIYDNSTPIIKDSKELSYPYIHIYNQVFVQNKKVKLIIHSEIYPIYLDKEHNKIIPNDNVSYYLKDNDDNVIARYHSLYQALCEFHKIK